MADLGKLVAASLRAAVLRSVEGQTTPSLLFSGGVDSSLVAWILKTAGGSVELVSISLAGGADAATAVESARMMELECHPHDIPTIEMLGVARGLRAENPTLSLNDVAIQTSMRLAISRATGPLVLSAQGADALFLGYAHAKGLKGNVLTLRAEDDLDKVVSRDLPPTRAFATKLGKKLATPFLDPSFLSDVSKIPWEARTSDTENKWLLRQAARELALPDAIVHRPKKTFQYGSGIYTELKKSL